MRIIKPNAVPLEVVHVSIPNQETWGEVYIKSDTIEIDLDDLYNRYEAYKSKITTEPIDSDYGVISFSQFTQYYITEKEVLK